MKQIHKKRRAEFEYCDECDDRFAYIAGYTGGDAPYGVTWKCWNQS